MNLPAKDSLAYAVLHYFAVQRYVGPPQPHSPAETMVWKRLGFETRDDFTEALLLVMMEER